MTGDHERYAVWAAAYTLGALDGEDRRAFEVHLAGCDLCAAELAELAPLPGLIAKVEPKDLDTGVDPVRAAAIAAAARRETLALRRRVRRWRSATAASAVAAVIFAFVALFGGGNDRPRPPTQAASIVSTVASSAEIGVASRAWGAELTLYLEDLPERSSYQLWTDNGGERVLAATWLPTPSGAVRLTGASRTPVAELDRILVTSQDRSDVLLDATP